MVAATPCPELAPYVERELEHRWQAATRDQRARGRRWYDTARQLMDELASSTGYTLEQAVAVLAITSPGAQLTQNVRWTRLALESRGTAKVGRFPNAIAPKVAAVLASPDAAAEYVRGPKVGPFHRAILGDADELVLDRWATYAAAPLATEREDFDSLLTATVRPVIEQAYRAVARRARLKVRDLQAVVWLQVRESTPKIGRNGQPVTVRYADITAA